MNPQEQEIEILKEELDHFVKLSQAQAKQIDQYVELQKESLELIAILLGKLSSKGTNKHDENDVID